MGHIIHDNELMKRLSTDAEAVHVTRKKLLFLNDGTLGYVQKNTPDD